MPKTAKSDSKAKKQESFEASLWQSADKLRKNMDAAEYKHVVLGLVFLKYISDAFEVLRSKFVAGKGEYAGAMSEEPTEYWHIISEGCSEEERTPDLRRCERIRWPKAVIENNTHPGIKIWQNRRKSETGICIWLEEKEYLVILRNRADYILFWTAYPVVSNHSKRKLEAEYQAYKMARAALSDGSVTPST